MRAFSMHGEIIIYSMLTAHIVSLYTHILYVGSHEEVYTTAWKYVYFREIIWEVNMEYMPMQAVNNLK